MLVYLREDGNRHRMDNGKNNNIKQSLMRMFDAIQFYEPKEGKGRRRKNRRRRNILRMEDSK